MAFNQADYPDTTAPITAGGERATFIARTYMHLFGAIVAFTFIEVALFRSGMAEQIARTLLGTNWLIVLGGFMVVSWLASRFAHTSSSIGVQYAALGGFVIAEAIIFVPLLYMANSYAPGAISSAAMITLMAFGGLTAVVMLTRKDFSFLKVSLRYAGVLALVAIVASVLFGFQLGTWFSLGMVALAGVAVLYDTSNILRHFPSDRYVGAALQLFASVALMFWYVLRLTSRR
jgi:FtsH-binding integral membrane protein